MSAVAAALVALKVIWIFNQVLFHKTYPYVILVDLARTDYSSSEGQPEL